MPNWDLHINVANDIAKRCCPKDYKSFLLGSIIPDCPWMTTADAVMSGMRDRLHCYHQRNGMFNGEAGITRWVTLNERNLRNSDLYKGILTHILLDNEMNSLWNGVAAVDGVNMISLPDGQLITQNRAAGIKWLEVQEFNKHHYGNVRIWKNFPAYEFAEQNRVVEDFGLDEDEFVNAIISINDYFDQYDYEPAKGYTFIVPISVYDRLITIVILKYMNILDSMRIK